MCGLPLFEWEETLLQCLILTKDLIEDAFALLIGSVAHLVEREDGAIRDFYASVLQELLEEQGEVGVEVIEWHELVDEGSIS